MLSEHVRLLNRKFRIEHFIQTENGQNNFWNRMHTIFCYMLNTNCFNFHSFLIFSDPKSIIWFGRYNLWTLFGTLLDLFWSNSDRKGCNQNAYTESVYYLGLQWNPDWNCGLIFEQDSRGWFKIGRSIQRAVSKTKGQTA